ncbi:MULTISPECIES: hypothetical protein [Streptomyces]|uniref:hypothetical protein n=1 Tax=Streptomyces TaxID=1883 RepID=UPI00240D30A0|nr:MULTISPECIES: hypothetical protein [Streptomyces]WFB83796.1 hypothetical protein MMU79_11015 [Streptomyces olivaceus]WGK50585.1 hypothetical protein M6G09_35985 [Streptomyces sp. B146]
MSILLWRSRATRHSPHAGDIGMAHPLALHGERMASRISSVFFTANVSGSWRHVGAATPHQDPAALARDHLRRQAAQAVREYSVLNAAAAQDAANAALAQPPRGCPLDITGSVHLEVTDLDRGLAEEHARRKQTADLDHEEETYRLAHLQRILADKDLRRVWWIARFPDRFTDLEGLKTALDGLPSCTEPADDDLRGDIRTLTDRLVTALHTPEQREVFLHALVQTLTIVGHHDLASDAARWRTAHVPGSPPE